MLYFVMIEAFPEIEVRPRVTPLVRGGGLNCPAWAGVSHLHRRSKPRLLIGQGLGLDALATFELGTFLRQEIGFWIGGFIACVLHSAEARTFLLHSCGLRSIYFGYLSC